MNSALGAVLAAPWSWHQPIAPALFALERNAKENFRFPPGVQPFDFDPKYPGKHLQVEFIVEVESAFT